MKESSEDSLLATAGAVTLRAPEARRRHYDPPELIEWGSLTQLTLGGSGGDYDIDNGATKAV